VKVYYKTYLRGELAGSSWVFERNSPDDIWEYKFERADFCCRKMENAFCDRFIFFGEYDGTLNEDNNMNISICKPYPEGACWDELSIKLCPFCGETIELIESARFSKVKTTKIMPEKVKIEYVDALVSEFTTNSEEVKE